MAIYIDIGSGMGLATPKPIPLPKTPIAPGINPLTYGPQPAPIQPPAVSSGPSVETLNRPTAEQQAIEVLQPYKVSDNSYDLVKVMQAAVNKSEVRQAAELIFDKQDIHYAEYAAKPAIDALQWEKLSPERQKMLRPVADVTESEYTKMTDWQKLGVKNITPDKSPTQSAWQKAKGGLTIAAEILVPGVYEARNWDNMSPAEKALMIVLDVVSLIPFSGSAVRGARMAYPQTSRIARLTGAAKGVGKEAIAFVRTPVDLVVHPIQTVKGAGTGVKSYARNIESLIENVAHPSKIPEAVITTTHGTVRLPLSSTTSTKEALEFQTKLMELANKGERPVVIMGDLRVELPRSPLMKNIGGGLAHATPMGEAWEYGGKVINKVGRPSREQGLFLSHEPLPRFTLATAYGEGGEKPVIWIMSKETAEKAIQAEKTYRSTVEMERRLKIGERLYEPKQRLFTRVGPMQERVEIWLEKPLTRVQIAKLKAQALVESIKTLAKPSIKISKLDRGLTDDELRALSKIIGESDTELAGRVLRAGRAASRGRSSPPSLARVLGRVGAGDRVSVSAARRSEPELRREVARADRRMTPREPGRTPPREPVRESPREPGRTPSREPVREPPREPERVPPGREPPREPPREPGRTPPRVPPREPPPRVPPDKGIRVPPPRPPGSSGLRIVEAKGIPERPGIVQYDMGFSRVRAKPPYRKGTKDIDFIHLKEPATGKGSEQATLRVYDGDAPQKLVLGHGWKRTTILYGEELHNSLIKPKGRGIVIGMDGRIRKSRKRGILPRRRGAK